MNPEISIEIDYSFERKDPAAIFEAMALYIDAYKDLGQILVNSLDIKADFEFKLNGISEGCIISKIGVVKGLFTAAVESAIFNSGISLYNSLAGVKKTESEAEVEVIASDLENQLSQFLPDELVGPKVDRQKVAYVLSKMSEANSKLRPDESVSLSANEDNVVEFNTSWRFTGDPKKMFLGSVESHQGSDKLFVKITVNEGSSVWTFRSPALGRSFSARIAAKDWLERYQTGMTQAIGPLDMLEVELSYDIYTPAEGRGQPEIRNAKILQVIDIHRCTGHQYELPTS
jgi:hypothetical protein